MRGRVTWVQSMVRRELSGTEGVAQLPSAAKPQGEAQPHCVDTETEGEESDIHSLPYDHIASWHSELSWWLRWQSICLRRGRPGFDPWVGQIPWRSKWQPTPVFLPGKSHGRRSLVGYSPRGRKELDATERLHFQQVGKVGNLKSME